MYLPYMTRDWFLKFMNVTKHPYAKRGRLADVLALIQVLALDEHCHRSESGLENELQGAPKSSSSWSTLAKHHPEFFRVSAEKTNKVCLVARHVQITDHEKTKKPLCSDFVGKLLQAAIELHDREMERKNHWRIYIPIIVAVTAGLFTILGVFLKTYIQVTPTP